MRALVTGGTGAIGVPLVRKLLREGWQISLLSRRPALTDGRDTYGAPTEVVPGEVTRQLCGVTAGHKKKFDVLIHAAGKTQYHPELRDETYQTNVTGTANALELATELGISRFVYISTCYVAGKAAYLGEDEYGRVEDAHNPYEASKIDAEALVRAYAGRSLILRLSTVIGDSGTGEVANAGGYAAFVRAFWIARERLSRYPDNPFWVGLNPESTLNLIPNDWVADHIWKATAAGMSGTLHLSHPQPVKMGWLFEQSVAKLGYPLSYRRSAVELTALWGNHAWRRTQEAITRQMVGYFGSYVTRDTTFGHDRIRSVPGYVEPLPISKKMIAVQMDFMTRRLFPMKRTRRQERQTGPLASSLPKSQDCVAS